jgi:hypothetical protein
MKQIGVLEVDIKYLYVSFATPDVHRSRCSWAAQVPHHPIAEPGCPATRGRYVKESHSDAVYLPEGPSHRPLLLQGQRLLLVQLPPQEHIVRQFISQHHEHSVVDAGQCVVTNWLGLY